MIELLSHLVEIHLGGEKGMSFSELFISTNVEDRKNEFEGFDEFGFTETRSSPGAFESLLSSAPSEQSKN